MKPGKMAGLTIGIVTDVKDQENLGSVRVTYPWLDDDLKSDWISMVSPFAGKDRGIYWMPEVGDEVVVGFMHGDFDQAVVLGAMWNAPNPGPTLDPRERILRSKNGHSIRFVDSTVVGGNKGALVIQDAHESAISMTAGFVTISVKGTLILEANAIQLRGKGWKRTITPNSNAI
jgi:phage baseplate assembly protein V